MNLTEKDFETFKKHFNNYVKMFSLTGYQINFDFMVLKGNAEDSFAAINTDTTSMIADIALNKFIPKESVKNLNIQRTAKHEAVHLLLGELDNLARARYATPPEIKQATEKLVNKLVDLIKD